MSFAHPWAALVAAAIALPLLLLLYFLKLRRRRLAVPSTLLWRRAHRDLEVNTPLQRLRRSLLLFLQLALVAIVVLAIGEPAVRGTAGAADRTIILIDRSASMNATDAEPPHATRLAAARQAARDIVEAAESRDGAQEILLIAFGARAQLLTGFERRPAVLLEAIAAIEPSDEEADLAAALELAASFAAPEEAAPADVVLISDGGVAPPRDARPADGFVLRSGRVRFVQAGPAPDPPPLNVGIVEISARRDERDPGTVLVFTRIAGTAAAPIDVALTLYADGAAATVERTRLPAAAPGAPAEASCAFSIDLQGGSVLAVGHDVRDVLAADDMAAIVMPPPARPRILLVHGGAAPDPFLQRLLLESDPGALRTTTAAAYAEDERAEVEVARRHDVVVFDGVTPARLPPIPALFVGAAPPGVSARAPAQPGGRRILSWRREDPIMRHVALDEVAYEGFGAFDLPADATALATGPEGAVIAAFRERGVPSVAVGFALARSNWPAQVSIAIFMQNVLEHATLARSGRFGLVARPGAPIDVESDSGAGAIVVEGDVVGGRAIEVPAGDDGPAVTLPALRRAGVYRVRGAAPPHDRVAVSMLSAVETDVRPRGELLVNAEPVIAGARQRAAPRELWPWLLAASLAVLVVEWIVYCRLARA
jgi:hypothetical protein